MKFYRFPANAAVLIECFFFTLPRVSLAGGQWHWLRDQVCLKAAGTARRQNRRRRMIATGPSVAAKLFSDHAVGGVQRDGK